MSDMATTVTEFMGQDHDRLDEIFKGFQHIKTSDTAKAKGLFVEFLTGLQRHIVWEEEMLFPLFENATGMRDHGPTAVMRMEHRQIKDFLKSIHDKIAAGDTTTDESERGLLEVLTAHNQKEENILYPWIDNSVGEEEREAVFTQMKNVPPEKYSRCCE
jgi:regulator of cell morphogenesis and NO signaling